MADSGRFRQARGHGEDAIYFAADKNRDIGAVSVGFGPGGRRVRRKVSGKTKQEVRDKLKALHAELDAGVQSSAGYSSGARSLRKLSAADVRSALSALNERLSTRWLQIAHNCLLRAIRHAEADDLIGRNVAPLVRPPTGRLGRTTGIRPEEARALRWDHLDPEAGTVAIWRSDRAGGDTKTNLSRRTLKLPEIALNALRQRKSSQAADRLTAGELWQGNGLVFTTTIGTMLDQHNIRREFRQITKAAGLGEDRVPRELRHTFVSIMSAGGVPVEEIARVAGHKQTSTTELVYRRELRPVVDSRGRPHACGVRLAGRVTRVLVEPGEAQAAEADAIPMVSAIHQILDRTDARAPRLPHGDGKLTWILIDARDLGAGQPG